MKQPKKLTRNQKEILVKKGMNPDDYMLHSEDEKEMILYNRKEKRLEAVRSKQEVHDDLKLGRRQKRILKRKLKRIAGDVVAVIVGAGMFVGLFIAWANEPMPDWSEYIEENHIGMVQVEGSDTWLTQEEYEQMCKERDAYKAAEQAEEQSYYNAILQSTETPVPTTTAAIGSLDWDVDDSYRLAKIAMAEAEGEDTEGKALVILVVLNRV